MYDAEGHATLVVWKDAGGTVTDTQSFVYDPDGNLLSATNAAGTVTMGYDTDGRMTSRTDPSGVTLTFHYDGDGRATLVTDSLGATEATGYDAAGSLVAASLSTPSGSLAATLGYDGAGGLTSITRSAGAGGTATYARDDRGRVTSIAQTDGAGAVVEADTYGYDAGSRMTTSVVHATGTSGGFGTAYGYDATNQMTAAGPATYTYDANGNRTGPGVVIDPGNRIHSDGTWVYTYDAAGNTIAKSSASLGTEWDYTYDDANQMTSATETVDGVVITTDVFQYDAVGDRVSQVQTVSGVTLSTWYVTTGSAAWADVTAGVGTTWYLNGNGPDARLGRVDSAMGGATFWDLTDPLGSVLVVAYADGSVADQITYDPFGSVSGQTDVGKSGRMLYDGYEYDPATGLYHDGIRYLNPAEGRFTTQDPTGLGPDSNPYRYVGNGPKNGTDPTGKYADGPSAVPVPDDVKVWRQAYAQKETLDAERRALEQDQADFSKTNPGMIRSDSPEGEKLLDNLLVRHVAVKDAEKAIEDSIKAVSDSSLRYIIANGTATEKIVAQRERDKRDRLESEQWRREKPLRDAAALQELLESRRVERERPGKELTRIALGIIPYVGNLMSAYEVISGHTIFGDPLSKRERVVIGVFTVIPVFGRLLARLSPLLKTTARGSVILKELEEAVQLARVAKTAEEEAEAIARLSRLTKEAGAELEKIAAARTGGCFAAGTPLLTLTGSRPVERLQPGDYVLSQDEHDPNGSVDAKVIKEVFVRFGMIWWLTVAGQRIGTTAEHPFYVVGSGWRPAAELIPGDILGSHDRTQIVVEAIEPGEEWATVYNVHVADWHTYFVGCDEWGFSVWAHNNACDFVAELKKLFPEDRVPPRDGGLSNIWSRLNTESLSGKTILMQLYI
ncbi:polymorphic toxin-type HINT domain-containing protein [Fimbriiglobus ruber]|uniref:polymorphic toxin-type HINT domain-containing protein n=1 Tax=Fimbriiglobus ruber TaxID=1908690 RepID=UPI000B4BD48E